MLKVNVICYCKERIFEIEIGKFCIKIGMDVQGLVDLCVVDIEVRKKVGYLRKWYFIICINENFCNFLCNIF